MSKIIAIGPYSGTDAKALQTEFDAQHLPDLAAIAGISFLCERSVGPARALVPVACQSWQSWQTWAHRAWLMLGRL